jgi:hypothetical protein
MKNKIIVLIIIFGFGDICAMDLRAVDTHTLEQCGLFVGGALAPLYFGMTGERTRDHETASRRTWISLFVVSPLLIAGASEESSFLQRAAPPAGLFLGAVIAYNTGVLLTHVSRSLVRYGRKKR